MSFITLRVYVVWPINSCPNFACAGSSGPKAGARLVLNFLHKYNQNLILKDSYCAFTKNETNLIMVFTFILCCFSFNWMSLAPIEMKD